MVARDQRIPTLLILVHSGSITITHALAASRDKKPFVLPKITHSSTKTFSLSDDATPSQYLKVACRALEEGLNDEVPHGTPKPHQSVLLFGVPWVVTQTRTILFRKSTAFTVTKRMIDDLVKKEVAYVAEHDMAQFAELGTDTSIIEQQTTNILLNGYETMSPFGKKATTLSITLTITIASKAVVKGITDTISRHYRTKHLAIASTTIAGLVVARDLWEKNKEGSDCFVVSVSEELTDVSFIKNNALLYHQSMAIGTRSFIKKISEASGASSFEAISTVKAYQQGALEEGSNKKVRVIIDDFKTAWTSEIQKIFDTHIYGLCAPSNGIVVAEQSWESFFIDALMKDQFLLHSAGVKTLAVEPIIPASTREGIDPIVGSTQNALAALFITRMI